MRFVAIAVILILCSPASAFERVRVLALFPGKAMLEVNGTRKVLSAGQPGPGGVKLISANPREAVVLVNGERRTLQLGTAVSASYQQVAKQEFRILSDGRGAYFTDGLINGQPVRFLVDTGATTVALSARHARKLGIDYVAQGKPTQVGTASGQASGYVVKLRSLKVGGVQLADLRAVVMDGDSPRHALLGMNVLEQFDMDKRENMLILRRKF